MIKLLIGGSPCTHWSIAQTKNRETEPSGIGWELFLNFLIALEKYRPDYFLYENNKSMSKAIRAEITRCFGFDPICINSSKVSAQNRERLYWLGKREPDGTYSKVAVEQPEDRGILLRDILESGVCWQEKGYLKAQYSHGVPDDDSLKRRQNTQVAEPLGVTKDGKAYVLRAQYEKSSVINSLDGGHFPAPMAAEPINITKDGKSHVAEPVRIGTIESGVKNEDADSQQYRVYSPDGKSVTLCGQGGGLGAKTGLYAVPCGAALRGRQDESRLEIRGDQKATAVIVGHQSRLVIEAADGKTYPVYEVKDGQIFIKDNLYPINLPDGYYIIRKTTVTECKRLQTVPEGYIFPVSNSQAYKMLGNGWTVDVIAYLLGHISGISTEPIEVLSMYDGMSCGHIALDKLGATVIGYYATEIDKYAIKTTQTNYPDTVQLGNAFQVREDGFMKKLMDECFA